MRKVLIASKNQHKIDEIKIILKSSDLEVLTLNDFEKMPDVEETSATIEGNSLKKALEISKWSGIETIADDTGLEISSLNGAPGVHTARFAGVGCSSEENILKTLKVMERILNREAKFKTVITLAKPTGEFKQFTGILEGSIATKPCGKKGFGYDPIFIVKNFNKTLAEIGEEKHKISHRALALKKLMFEIKKSY
ncbi:MAG: RdgB/HAM1 family non-canonical purine NTP pyrophosphatase [Fusobacteria bacterium]|nr:RdgB/HAM1 family non-canonical purine NTP pyrophosphatase [Fusobacteriota bacterium]